LNKSSRQLNVLLDNLLNWSRVQTGRMPVTPESIDLYDLAENSLELHKANAENKQISLINTVDKGMLIKADQNMITLVMRNLVTNAVKFTPEGGKIKISAYQKGNKVEIAVEDTGIGISKDDIGKLFRIDVHFSLPGTNQEAGTGLGLVLCKEFVAKNNGAIRVESEPGKGSKFIVTMPTA